MPRTSTRTAILDAAEELARSVGLVRVTTKAVATAASCSEASIYYHFKDRADLLGEVVAGRFQELNEGLASLQLPEDADTGERLTALVAAVANAYNELIALSTSLFADPEVLARFRAVLDRHGVSLHGMQTVVAERIRRDQQAGRLRDDVDPAVIALLIAGTCHEIALEGHLTDAGHQHSNPHAVHTLGTTLRTLLETR